MQTIKRLGLGVLLCALLFVSVVVGLSAGKKSPSSNWIDESLSISEVTLLCALVSGMTIVLMLIELFLLFFRDNSRSRLLRPSTLLLVTGTVVAAPATSAPVQPMKVPSFPISSVLSPAICLALVQKILQIRREQISARRYPQRLTEENLQTLKEVERTASSSDVPSAVHTEALPREVFELLDAVTATTDQTPDLTFAVRDTQPSIIVHLFGYPLVRNQDGITAEFRKKRALELLTWLSLNRDRARRSAARTAMWEIAIHDSTFSTVVSDMRRGLSVLDTSAPSESLVPITYSDDISLSANVVSDAEILARALQAFQQDENCVDNVLNCLQWLRDVPFAGTSYSWADLDGSTTRLVILGVTAATEVARWAIRHQNADALTSAVRAGLRVMPGNEELLELQRSALSSFGSEKLPIV